MLTILKRRGLQFAAITLLLLPLAECHGGDKHATPVPPGLEIEILDPNADPNGNPAVLLKDSAQSEDTQQVEIPPVVLVHRYYYTGDRTFQGPMLPGGPSIVVASHPVTNERVYVPLQMLPGAPRVIYRRNSIEFDYGAQGIKIHFSRFCDPHVVYRHRRPLLRTVGAATVGVAKSAGHLIHRTGISEAGRHVWKGTKAVATTTVDGIRESGRIVATPVAQVVEVLPFAKMFSGSPEETARRLRDQDVERIGNDAALLDATIPTNR